ncbi:hypothetical protein FEM48_Zijuj12G0214800 [Ziziphus jujuba var. spinosa]|uniref:Reverse transcriptase RNase H-like domain-containing protein n=1 Tax=Ziziphus jujuba var. spinosa TaxID=714518 RepID=A0A978UFN2_ZIZJJ|nr:hypothetical protein FEM48_Zijuj12G0214800 [Ziziphus jujuba var. spinosa]
MVKSDAHGNGIRAILMQQERPIAYHNEALKVFTLTLSTYEKEMLAIIKAIQKWHPYLLKKPFIVQTDQRILKFLMEQRITTPTQVRWLPKLMGYQYSIEYKKSKNNCGADALSQQVDITCHAISLPRLNWRDILKEEVLIDHYYNRFPIAMQLLCYSCLQHDGIWFRGGRICLSPTSASLPVLLAKYHCSLVAGHFRYTRTLSGLKKDFYCPGMKASVINASNQIAPNH